MKLTVLLDNNTLIDRYLQGEPGLSYLIEADGRKILFDVGYSDLFLRNAQKLAISLLDLDFVVLSHGHLDHTWGLFALIQYFTEGIVEKRAVKRPTLVAHPAVFASKQYAEMPEVGSLLTSEKLARFFDVQLTREPRQLTEHLRFLGEIERVTAFEAQKPMGRVIENGQERGDDLRDDSALVCQTPSGLVIITGCSHSGICNITSYAQKLTSDQRVVDIIGGFHLLNPPADQLTGTVDYLNAVQPAVLHACHCTDLKSKTLLSRSLELQEVGAGLVLVY